MDSSINCGAPARAGDVVGEVVSRLRSLRVPSRGVRRWQVLPDVSCEVQRNMTRDGVWADTWQVMFKTRAGLFADAGPKRVSLNEASEDLRAIAYQAEICRQVPGCHRPAAGTVSHPVVGEEPTCLMHARDLRLTLVSPLMMRVADARSAYEAAGLTLAEFVSALEYSAANDAPVGVLHGVQVGRDRALANFREAQSSFFTLEAEGRS